MGLTRLPLSFRTRTNLLRLLDAFDAHGYVVAKRVLSIASSLSRLSTPQSGIFRVLIH
jgi:hypothetical protein